MGLFSSKKKAPKREEKIEMISDASAGGANSSHNQLN
jgi:hypothetical protein